MAKCYKKMTASERRQTWTERSYLLSAERSLFKSLRGPVESPDDVSMSVDLDNNDYSRIANSMSGVYDSGSVWIDDQLGLHCLWKGQKYAFFIQVLFKSTNELWEHLMEYLPLYLCPC